MTQSSQTISVKSSDNFVETDQVKNIIERSKGYLQAGFPVHFSGATGTGKTTLALRLASLFESPVVLLHGNNEYDPPDLMSKQQGYSREKIVDNFIHSVVKIKENMKQDWADSKLLSACKHGYTLVYDEFTRSQPEANNILLSILAMRMLSLPEGRNGENYIEVHPEFKAIFTSNPEEYAGVHESQNALLDRMITLDLTGFNEETETEIILSHSNINRKEAKKVLGIVRGFGAEKEGGAARASVRPSIMISEIIQELDVDINWKDETFRQICRDVLLDASVMSGNKSKECQLLDDIIRENS